MTAMLSTFAIIFFMLGTYLLLTKHCVQKLVQEIVWLCFVLGYIFLICMFYILGDWFNFALVCIAMTMNLCGFLKVYRAES
jgi:peptidoglycan/LPS O-acetylase OafA/YrhL